MTSSNQRQPEVGSGKFILKEDYLVRFKISEKKITKQRLSMLPG